MPGRHVSLYEKTMAEKRKSYSNSKIRFEREVGDVGDVGDVDNSIWCTVFVWGHFK